MFTNPLESFHKAVADAKNDREQLHLLLTISTPRERALLGGILVLSLGFCAWLFFGTVDHTLTANGAVIESQVTAQDMNRRVQTNIWGERDNLSRVATGMQATFEVKLPNGDSKKHIGKIARVSDIPFAAFISGSRSGFAESLDTESTMAVKSMILALDDEIDIHSLQNREIKVIIALDRISPISLFLIRGK